MSELQPKARELPSYLAPTIWIPVFTAILLAYISYQLGLNAQLKLTGKQKRQQAYSELMGQKVIVKHLSGSLWSSVTHRIYYEHRRKLTNDSPEWSFYTEQMNREFSQSESIEAEMVKSYQRVFETLGLIRSAFRYSARLNTLIYQIYYIPWSERKEPVDDLNVDELNKWKDKTIKDFTDIRNEYENKLNELLTYLEAEINKEAG